MTSVRPRVGDIPGRLSRLPHAARAEEPFDHETLDFGGSGRVHPARSGAAETLVMGHGRSYHFSDLRARWRHSV